MYKVKILDELNKIAMLKWEGMVKTSEVSEVTKKLEEIHKTFGSQKFYILVDVKDLKIFSPDAKEEIVQQQKWIKSKIYRSAVVMDKKLIEKQLEEVSGKSTVDELEVPFPSYEEALAFLKDLASKKV